ncbi:swarming motility protein SwrB [Kurthia zopfii]|uniref:Coupling factor for flagellin transcription and translation n=2 Tax=Kurthia zopfii TaxID=1650 RepID=A0A2U3ADZ4_9BACL|nr:hypothetical protein [Kurthia zopfii]PWI22756.1 hypothetical protein DF281_05465 [Kurthia zopfii]TDR41797.1 hypothetical protein DFR61_10536 [Kurthia zopfii]STX09108.1 Uncharacterised protein [Kurthia zopfii]VEI04677.1 Uncharacterised protein [Kurthia zopfii]GEK30951.1 swarming motility protein SwrB [Kurthia zopfii]
MGILIAVLFILLMICFYFIALLNMKLNRFQKNEHKQELLMEEMESSIANFLTEIEDENNRLIQIINSKEKQLTKEDVQPTVASVEQAPNDEPTKNEEKVAFTAPRSYVKKAYLTESKPSVNEIPKVERTLEQKVKDLYIKGQSIAEIAKQLNKGKTEVELLLKFQKNK